MSGDDIVARVAECKLDDDKIKLRLQEEGAKLADASTGTHHESPAKTVTKIECGEKDEHKKDKKEEKKKKKDKSEDKDSEESDDNDEEKKQKKKDKKEKKEKEKEEKERDPKHLREKLEKIEKKMNKLLEKKAKYEEKLASVLSSNAAPTAPAHKSEHEKAASAGLPTTSM